MKEIPLTQGRVAIVDDEDYEALIKRKWCFSACTRRSAGYASRYLTVEGKKVVIRMHRHIMGLRYGDGMEVDHIDGNRLNNRRSNLRVCTHAQNAKNNALSRRNKSGFTGVRFHPIDLCYVAAIVINSKKIHLGNFKTIEEAKKARLDSEIQHFGEFRRKSF